MKLPLNRKAFVAAALLVCGAVLAFLLRSSESAAEAAKGPLPEPTTPRLEGRHVRYSEDFARREGLSLVPVREAELTPTFQATGVVTYDARRVASVGARIAGRVHELHAIEGEPVKAGQLLAELESVELGKAQAEVLKARAREQVALLDAARERSLADAKISPARDAEHARANAEALTAERVAAEKAVEAMGGTAGGEMGVLRLKSPIAGRVVETKIHAGATVEPSDELFLVADVSRVWVELNVFEQDLPGVSEGDAVDLHLPSAKTARLLGTIAHVGEVVAADTRAARVRVELDNTERLLRPGQSVVATIHASGRKATHLLMPRAAVTRIDGRSTVFVQVGPGQVEPREVTLGAEDSEHVAVARGLSPGDKVVVGGVLALKSELFR